MQKLFVFLLLVALSGPTLAQHPFRYTVWADGFVNAQLPKSNLYGLGVGGRLELSKPLRNGPNALFVQAGYGRFFEKAAFTADIGLLNVGYRYQSRRAFQASVGLGAQYRSERMRLQFADGTVDETFNHFMPSATAGLGFRLLTRYRVGLENRVLFKPESGTLTLRNTLVLSLGYTF
ncbi:hypothetical protein ACO2Q8_00970 [Larkinella sp. VNQ87]|uniref:hypothetical protein n=1 Tax=Larkinella sp. VNQ87 TaxID=3400921 RepID=UPI003C0592CC